MLRASYAANEAQEAAGGARLVSPMVKQAMMSLAHAQQGGRRRQEGVFEARNALPDAGPWISFCADARNSG